MSTRWPEPRPEHRVALVLVDVVNAFFDESGAFYYAESRVALDGVRRLLDAARRGSRLVVHAREVHRPELADAEAIKLPPHCYAGGFDGEFVPGFEPGPGEPEIHKRRYSAFFATDLALLLNEQRAEAVVVAGVKTNVCIRATVQDALAYGFEPLVVEGAVNSNRPHLHDATLEDVRRYLGRVLPLDEAERLLDGGPVE
jgi:nicotinamidase-related amidase